MVVVKRNATYADLEALPEHVVGELIEGVLYAAPRPRMRHGFTSAAILGDLHGPFQNGRGGPGGWWLIVEPELRLGASVVIPDLAGWRRARMPEVPDVVGVEVAPDWVCEVLSPSTARVDRRHKLHLYVRNAVGHAWLVDPLLRTLEAFERVDDRWQLLGTWGDDNRVRVAPFDAVELELAAWWPPTQPGAAAEEGPAWLGASVRL